MLNSELLPSITKEPPEQGLAVFKNVQNVASANF